MCLWGSMKRRLRPGRFVGHSFSDNSGRFGYYFYPRYAWGMFGKGGGVERYVRKDSHRSKSPGKEKKKGCLLKVAE